MKPYYYVFKKGSNAPTYKHLTLESAVAESTRLSKLQPKDTFEVLQCVAITNTFIPEPSTFFLDGVVANGEETNKERVNMPDGLPPLPKLPRGYKRWEYRGKGWKTNNRKRLQIAYCLDEDSHWYADYDIPEGNQELHYLEAVK